MKSTLCQLGSTFEVPAMNAKKWIGFFTLPVILADVAVDRMCKQYRIKISVVRYIP